jgi:hypothetical protein
VDSNLPLPDPSTAPIPKILVCNEYVFFAYGRAGEKIPYTFSQQIDYFKKQNRFTTDSAKGEVGDVAFFSGPPEHEVVITEVKEKDGVKMYRYAGTHNSGSGEMLDKDGRPAYVDEKGHGASLIDGKLVLWKTVVRGHTGLKGFGKAGR